MSPLQISIAIHYYASATDFRNGDFSAPAVDDTIAFFLKHGMLCLVDDPDRKYGPTDRLAAYVSHLCKIPLPSRSWVFPEDGA